jgi:isocitrate dehydrogenase (NAD+)
VHGSAPDIAGRGIANPCALLLAAADMLDYLDMVAKGNQLRAAIRAAVENDRDQITPDLGGKGSTDSFADAIVQRLHA